MQDFSFIKGLIIGTFLSAMFWVGAYYTISNLTGNDSSNESTPTLEIIEHQARL